MESSLSFVGQDRNHTEYLTEKDNDHPLRKVRVIQARS